jgi:hypothetical protein
MTKCAQNFHNIKRKIVEILKESGSFVQLSMRTTRRRRQDGDVIFKECKFFEACLGSTACVVCFYSYWSFR